MVNTVLLVFSGFVVILLSTNVQGLPHPPSVVHCISSSPCHEGCPCASTSVVPLRTPVSSRSVFKSGMDMPGSAPTPLPVSMSTKPVPTATGIPSTIGFATAPRSSSDQQCMPGMSDMPGMPGCPKASSSSSSIPKNAPESAANLQSGSSSSMHDMDMDGMGAGMKTFLNSENTNVFLLFPSARPRTTVQYALAWIICFLLSLLSSSSDKIRKLLFTRRVVDPGPSVFTLDNKRSEDIKPSLLRRVSYTVFSGIFGFLGYMLMLVAMTLNVGLLIAIILGMMAATFCFNYSGSVVTRIERENRGMTT